MDTYHHGDLRNALVVAATDLVREVGVESFSLRDAARRVGVTANATYRHFDNKSDLLTAVAVVGFEKLAVQMRRKTSDAKRRSKSDAERAVEMYKAAARSYASFAEDEPELFRVMYGPSGACKVGLLPLPSGNPPPLHILGAALDALAASGVLPKARRPTAELRAWSVVHGFVSLVVDGPLKNESAAKRSEALEDLLEFVLDGLCCSRGA